jgi:hypothetical protein
MNIFSGICFSDILRIFLLIKTTVSKADSSCAAISSISLLTHEIPKKSFKIKMNDAVTKMAQQQD